MFSPDFFYQYSPAAVIPQKKCGKAKMARKIVNFR
jgi:hypothetical protein